MDVPIEPSLGNLPTTPGIVANAGPVAFPYVATYYDAYEQEAVDNTQYHQVSTPNFPYEDVGVGKKVTIYGGQVYCGLARVVTVDDKLSATTGTVYLNLYGLHTATPSGSLSQTSKGQVSLLLYDITKKTITDYRHRMILPLYS